MSKKKTISLDHIRTDGWFERLGESIGSFHTLCEVLGEHFFAFALITGARVSSLMIDRFNPDQSLVEFSFSANESEAEDADAERLTVVEFRQRLVATLLTQEPDGPELSKLNENAELLQQHIGPRSLLLAPLYGYRVNELTISEDSTSLGFTRHGGEEAIGIAAFRERLLDHVKDDLERGVRRRSGTAIDLKNVDEAEKAAADNDWQRVLQLLGSWPMPLSIYWRTPEGQMLPPDARQRIAEGLGLLGTACSKLGDNAQGEEVLRLAVQYAQDGSSAPLIFARLGGMFLDGDRPGEAIGPLRRAYALGGEDGEVLPLLIRAFLSRDRRVAALAYLLEAKTKGVENKALKKAEKDVRKLIGDDLTRWEKLVNG